MNSIKVFLLILFVGLVFAWPKAPETKKEHPIKPAKPSPVIIEALAFGVGTTVATPQAALRTRKHTKA